MAEIHQLHQESDFDKAWKVWPTSIGKRNAQKAWLKAQNDPDWPGTEKLIECIKNYKQCKPDWKAWMHFSTYLNQARWLDEYERPLSDWEKLR